MKLTPRLGLVFIAYAAALLLGVGLLVYNSGRDSLRTATFSELRATALEKEAALNRWVEDKQRDILSLAEDPITVQEVSNLLPARPDSLEARTARNALISNLEPYLGSSDFLEVSLLHPLTGQILASTDPEEEGKFREDQPYFLNGKTGPFVQNLYYLLPLDTFVMTASSPVKTEQGELLGVLAARLDLETMNDIITRRTGLHDTDDAYLVNMSSLFVTQPRFISEPVVLQRGIHTEGVNRCLAQESGELQAVDYRNTPSFIVYRWLPERQLCLILKIDEAEAYHPVRAFGGAISVISLAALLVAVGLAYTLSRSMTRPLLALQSGAARIGRGELDMRLDDSSRDELGQLAGEFNKMAEALAEQQVDLRRRAEQFFNLSPDLLCSLTPAGRLQELNPAWELSLGYNREELKGHLLTEFVHPEDASLTQSMLQRIVKQKSGRFENRCQDRQGHYRWLAWVVVVSAQDQYMYAAARDITDRRLVEEQLRQQTEELERSNRDLEDIAHIASHDLQEPLRLVSTHVQLLARRYQGRLDQDADEFISLALEGIDRIKSLLSDLLAYTSISTVERELVPVEMEEVFMQVVNDFQPAIEDKGAVVTHDPLPAVLADPGQMILLLQNLLDNALKFHGKEPARVHVGVSQMSDRWLFFVRDSGIGIHPRYTERVFVIFQRLHSRDEFPGTGAGLAICRKIVERHGGRIWVDSEPGKGATFYFTLQPAESWQPEFRHPELASQPPRDTIADRATDLI